MFQNSKCGAVRVWAGAICGDLVGGGNHCHLQELRWTTIMVLICFVFLLVRMNIIIIIMMIMGTGESAV